MSTSILLLLLAGAVLLIILAFWLISTDPVSAAKRNTDIQIVESVSLFHTVEVEPLIIDPDLPRPAISDPLAFSASSKVFQAAIIGLAFIAAGIMGFYLTYHSKDTDERNYQLLQETGVETTAVVIRKTNSRKHQPQIMYVYQVPLPNGRDQELHNWATISLDEYRNLMVGQSRVPIIYSEREPYVSVLKSDFHPPQDFNFILALLGMGTFIIAGSYLLVVSGNHLFQIFTLNRHGQKTMGIVFDKWQQEGWRRKRRTPILDCVAYYFDIQDETGRLRVVRAENNAAAFRVLSEDNVVKVRYLPDKPEICRLEL